MRVELDDQTELVRLRDYLRRCGCLAFVNESRSLDVHPPRTTTAEDERLQVRLWVGVWNKLQATQARLL